MGPERTVLGRQRSPARTSPRDACLIVLAAVAVAMIGPSTPASGRKIVVARRAYAAGAPSTDALIRTTTTGPFRPIDLLHGCR